MNNSSIQCLVDSFIYYNQEYRLVICQLCKSVFPNNIARHLQSHHSSILSTAEQTAIIDYIDTLDTQQSENIIKNKSSEVEIDVIDGLPIHKLIRCLYCQMLSSESTIIKHCRNQHKWSTGQSIFYVYITNESTNMD